MPKTLPGNDPRTVDGNLDLTRGAGNLEDLVQMTNEEYFKLMSDQNGTATRIGY